MLSFYFHLDFIFSLLSNLILCYQTTQQSPNLSHALSKMSCITSPSLHWCLWDGLSYHNIFLVFSGPFFPSIDGMTCYISLENWKINLLNYLLHTQFLDQPHGKESTKVQITQIRERKVKTLTKNWRSFRVFLSYSDLFNFLLRVFTFLSLILCYSYFGTFLSTWSSWTVQ